MQSDNNQHLNNFFVLTLAFATFLLGFFLGNSQGFQRGVNQGKQENSAKIAELNKSIDLFFPPLPNEIFSVSGFVKEIKDSSLSLEINSSLTERFLPGIEPKKEIRKIIIGDKTEIVKIDFSALHAPFKQGEPPTVPKKTKIKLFDIKIGDQITATAKENIKTKTEFEAIEIQLQILPELPVVPVIPPPASGK